MTLEQASWAVAEALAQITASEGVDVHVIDIHSTELRSDGTVSLWLETNRPDAIYCGMPGLIAVAVDRHELERYSPAEALAIITGQNETKH
jgi:hypothetical protein